jgi:Flp pilus assembly protein TadG
MGAAALCLDVGQLYQVRREMVTAADAAALAAAQELIVTKNNQDSSKDKAEEYASENGAESCNVSFDVYHEGRAVTGVTVTTYRNVAPVFASVLGIGNRNVSAKATAVLAYPTKYSGKIWPLFYMSLDGTLPSDTVQVVYYKEGGNWGLLGHDATEVHDAFSGDDSMSITDVCNDDGELIIEDQTKTGQVISARIDGIEDRMEVSDSVEDMTGLIPIIEYKPTLQGVTEVYITGFAWFTITDVILGSTWEWADLDGDGKKDTKLYYGVGSRWAQAAFVPEDEECPKGEEYVYGTDGLAGTVNNITGPGYYEDKINQYYPKGAIIGYFHADKGIIRDLSQVLQADPDPDFDFNAVVVKLVD